VSSEMMVILTEFLRGADTGGLIICDAGCSTGRLLWAIMAMVGPTNNRFIGFDLDSRVDRGVTASTDPPSSWKDEEVTEFCRSNRVELHVAMATGFDEQVARVQNIDGVTHLMAVWESWVPADQTYLWEMFCHTTSAKVICMVMKTPKVHPSYFNPETEAKRLKFECLRLPAKMECGGTVMHAYIVRKPAGHYVTPRPESLVMWTPRKAGQGEGRGQRQR
jgi:hypothetical protein